MHVELLTYTPEPDKMVAAAAKLCYSASDIKSLMDNLTPDKVQSFVQKLNSIGHQSPLEHICFTFGIEGVSRITEQQLTRHRIASYSIQSGRYVKRDNLEYVIPPEIDKIPEAREYYIKNMEYTQKAYNDLVFILTNKYAEDYFKSMDIDFYKSVNCAPFEYLKSLDQFKNIANDIEKKSIEDARYVYPQSLATKIIVTMNARELLHLFNHRCCTRAQWEIRQLATQMLFLTRNISPNIFGNAGPNCLNKPCPEGVLSCGNITEVRKLFKSNNILN